LHCTGKSGFKGTVQGDDPADIRFIQNTIIKEGVAEVCRKFHPSPIL
jgi:hypothetical protein